MKVLIIESDKRTATYLQKALLEAGFVVEVCDSANNGLHMLEEDVYDIYVLAISSEGTAGWALLKAIRSRTDTPVLLLSERESFEERLMAFELGADDYIQKPISVSEVLARIRGRLRYSTQRDSEHLSILNLEINVRARSVFRGSRRIKLTSLEFHLLHFLARHRGEVMTRSEIVSQVWDANFDSNTNVVDVAIRRLRAKIDDPFDVRLIHTVRGMGYTLDPERSDV